MKNLGPRTWQEIIETDEKRNDLESYILTMRDQLSWDFFDFPSVCCLLFVVCCLLLLVALCCLLFVVCLFLLLLWWLLCNEASSILRALPKHDEQCLSKYSEGGMKTFRKHTLPVQDKCSDGGQYGVFISSGDREKLESELMKAEAF